MLVVSSCVSPNLLIFLLLTETSVLSDVEYVLCLDSIAKTDQLFLHVSKPPKEGTPAFALVEVECKLVLNMFHQYTSNNIYVASCCIITLMLTSSFNIEVVPL